MRAQIIRVVLLPATFVLWLILGSLASAQDAPKGHGRFFNDSAKAVNFYIAIRSSRLNSAYLHCS